MYQKKRCTKQASCVICVMTQMFRLSAQKLFMSRIITIQNPCSIDYDENCLIIISDSDELCIHWPSRNLILSQIVSFAPGIDELQIYLRDEMVISVRGPVEGDLSVSKLWAQALLRFEQISR